METSWLRASILGMVWLISPSVWATTVLEKDFADLVHEADTIVVGTVTAIETSQEREVPFTLVTFGALDIIKGTHQEAEFTVQVMGGPAPDGLRFHIAGVPTFHLGDRMVVFVVGNETHAVPFVGLWQGVFRVVRDTTGQETVATHNGRPLTALPQRRSADGLVYDGHGPHIQAQTGPALSLDTFLDAIAEEFPDGE